MEIIVHCLTEASSNQWTKDQRNALKPYEAETEVDQFSEHHTDASTLLDLLAQ